MLLSSLATPLSASASSPVFTFSAITSDPIYVGVAPVEGLYFEIDEDIQLERDFDQNISIGVVNNTADNLTFHLELTKQFDDLPADFSEVGSVFKDAYLPAGSTTYVDLRVFAQMAEKGEYTLPFKAVDSEGKTLGESSVTFTVPVVDLSQVDIELVDTDETTLAKTYRITNNSDMTITTLESRVDSKDCMFLSEPSLGGATLYSGSSEEITVFPNLAEMASKAMTSATAVVTISAGGQSKTYEDTFDANGTIEIVSTNRLALLQDPDNLFADMEAEPVSAVLTVNGTEITADNIGDLEIYDENGECVISVKNTVKDDVAEKGEQIEAGIKNIIDTFKEISDWFNSKSSGSSGDIGDEKYDPMDEVNARQSQDKHSYPQTSTVYGCANQGDKSSPFGWFADIFGGFSPRSGETTIRTAHFTNRQYSRQDKNTYVNENTTYTYKSHGAVIGTAETNGVTDLAIAELDTSNFEPGNVVVHAIYDTTPGMYAVIADFEFTQNIPADYCFGYIDNWENLPDIRSLPDYVVYEENIYSDNLFFTAGEQSDFNINVYNKGSSCGYVNVAAEINGTEVYSEIVFIPAFSKKVVSFSAVCPASRFSMDVNLTDMNRIDKETKTDNNWAFRYFGYESPIKFTTRVRDQSIHYSSHTSSNTLQTDQENEYTFTKDKLYVSVNVRNFRYNGNSIIESVKVYLNDEYFPDAMNCADIGGTMVYSISGAPPVIKSSEPLQLKEGENTFKIVFTYKNGENSTGEIVQTAKIYYVPEVDTTETFEIIWDQDFGEMSKSLFYIDENDRLGNTKLTKRDDKYMVTLADPDSIQAFFFQSDKGLYLGYIERTEEGSVIVPRDENNVNVSFHCDNAELTNVYLSLSPEIKNTIRFPITNDTPITLPDGWYGYTVNGRNDKTNYTAHGEFEALEENNVVNIVFKTDSFTEEEMPNKLTVNLDGYSADSVVSVTIDGRDSSYNPDGNNGVYNVPTGTYSVQIIVSSGGWRFYYYFENVDMDTSPTLTLSNKFSATLIDSNFSYDDQEYIYMPGEELRLFPTDYVTDSNGNVLNYACKESDEPIPVTIIFTDMETKKKYEVTTRIYSVFDSVECIIPDSFKGKYMAAIGINCEAPDIDFPDDDNPDDNPGGSTGGSSGSYGGGSFRPSRVTVPTEYKPKYNGVEMSWADIAKMIAALPVGSKVDIDLNCSYNVPAAVFSAIAERKAKVKFKYDSARSWSIDGAKILSAADADLSLTQPSPLDTSALTGIKGTLQHTVGTKLPTELSVQFKSSYAGQFANLYIAEAGTFRFVNSVKIADDGSASGLNLSEGGDYAIMISEFSGLPGDVNNDGMLNASDASAILKAIVGLEQVANPAAFDFNSDNACNAMDAADILKWIVYHA